MLVACKSISQTDTINKVILSENLAREVVKDLTEGDACKQISLLKDKKIENFKDYLTKMPEITSTKIPQLIEVMCKSDQRLHLPMEIDKV